MCLGQRNCERSRSEPNKHTKALDETKTNRHEYNTKSTWQFNSISVSAANNQLLSVAEYWNKHKCGMD